jgi:hypothetical protein
VVSSCDDVLRPSERRTTREERGPSGDERAPPVREERFRHREERFRRREARCPCPPGWSRRSKECSSRRRKTFPGPSKARTTREERGPSGDERAPPEWEERFTRREARCPRPPTWCRRSKECSSRRRKTVLGHRTHTRRARTRWYRRTSVRSRRDHLSLVDAIHGRAARSQRFQSTACSSVDMRLGPGGCVSSASPVQTSVSRSSSG